MPVESVALVLSVGGLVVVVIVVGLIVVGSVLELSMTVFDEPLVEDGPNTSV